MTKVKFTLIISLIALTISSFAYANSVANLTGEQEVPPVETQAMGQAVFTLSDDGSEIGYKILVSNLENITMAHIHIAPVGQNGAPVVWLYPSEPPAELITGVTNGVLAEGIINEMSLIGDLEGQPLSELLDLIKTKQAYVNIHTEQYPAGEIRGQLMITHNVMFKAVIENISKSAAFSSSGVFNTPDGATEPGPVTSGGSYSFNIGATPGSKVSFATMFVQSNDLFYAPGEMGISLFDEDGVPVSGDVTSQVMLWDAGTEVNQKPRIGMDQAPRQPGPDIGADEDGPVQIVDDGYTYPDIEDSINVVVTPTSGNEFEISIKNISVTPDFSSSGVFNTPDGAAEPGPLAPGSAYTFSVSGTPGSKVSFATMYVQSNDLFYAPDDMGISLFDENGTPLSGDITSQVMLWDAGTEVNQEPGVGEDQAPRQAGPDTGPDEDGPVQPVNDGFTYPAITDVLNITVTPTSDTDFEIMIENISTDDTFLLAPGVWVVHNGDAPLFAAGQPDMGMGLEALAEDGDPSGLASEIDRNTGVPVILAPGVWVVHNEDAPLFAAGQPDMGMGLEALAEDGNPTMLAEYLAAHSGTPVILAPGVWAVHTEDAPLFVSGQMDMGMGLEALAEDGDPSGLANALSEKPGVTWSGIFNTPMEASEPGPLTTGSSYEFHFNAFPGTKLSFATMFVQSNDLFYSPDEMGIELFNQYGGVVSGDVTSQVMLWDAGTEVNQRPGTGVDQAPRQSGPDTGADENGPVQLVNDGYMYPDISQSIRVTIHPIMPEEPDDKDYSHVFFMNLSAGLNMISLPLEPEENYTARSFAEMLDATVVIEYDSTTGKFVGFTPASPGDGFMIKGGMGYIINRRHAGVVTFTGAPWENEPQVDAAPPMAKDNTAWAFVVDGKISQEPGSYTVSVRNLRTNTVTADTINGTNNFTAVFADLSRNAVIQTGDMVEIVVTDNEGKMVTEPLLRQISGFDIQRAFVDVNIPLAQMMPKNTALLQNYPNPFNPETWIPFQLSEPSNVIVSIYNSEGKLVRVLDLGYKTTGKYFSKSEAIYWDGKNKTGEQLASGVYFYTLKAGSFISTRKMTVLK